MRTFYGYIRVSTTKQGEQGVSLDQQRSAIEGYAMSHGLELVRWFEGQETAARRGRPVFGEMLKLLKTGRASGVVIHKIDRSARNLRDWADLGELIDQGIAVHFANEALDLNSRGGRLAADIQAIISADFIRNLREETKKGFCGRLKQGLLPRPAPLGYLNCGKGKPKAVDPEKADYIRTAFELYASGTFNLKALTEKMYGLGLRGRGGQRVSVNGMSKILNNRFYTGTIVVEKTNQKFAGIHQTIVTPVLFNRVQTALEGKTNRKVVNHRLLFRRLFRCEQCGFHCIGEQHKGIVYYRCHTRNCATGFVGEWKLEQAILRELKKLECTQEEKNYFRGRVLELRKDWSRPQREMAQSLRFQINRLDERMRKLTDAYLDQLIDKEMFEQRKATLLEERRAIDNRLAEGMRSPLLFADQLELLLERAGSAYLTYKLATPDERRELVSALTSNRYVYGKSVKIKLNLPFDMVANRFDVPSGSPPRSTPRTWEQVINKILTVLPLQTPQSLAEHVM
jgi:site-specific DNA recombinase